MRTVGLIGGTGWPATRDYYVLLNQLTQRRLGGVHGLELRLWSFDFQALLARGEDTPGGFDAAFAEAGGRLRDAGAELLALASNTGHLFLGGLSATGLPLVHIAPACAGAMSAAGVSRAGVLATRRALAGLVFRSGFDAAGIALVPPPPALAQAVDEAIFTELEQGQPGPLIASALARACSAWRAEGLEHVLLGCTEIRPPLLAFLPEAHGLRLWDSTLLHCEAIVGQALAD